MATAGLEPSPRAPRGCTDHSHHTYHADHYLELRDSAEFHLLRARYLRAGALVTTCFLGCYLAYVVMSVFAREVMSTRLIGRIDVALVFGVLQIVLAFVLAWVYGRCVHRSIEPLADRVRSRAARAAASKETLPPYVPVPRHHPDGPPEGFYQDLPDTDPHEDLHEDPYELREETR